VNYKARVSHLIFTSYHYQKPGHSCQPKTVRKSGKTVRESHSWRPSGMSRHESGDRKGRPLPSDGRQETFPDGNSWRFVQCRGSMVWWRAKPSGITNLAVRNKWMDQKKFTYSSFLIPWLGYTRIRNYNIQRVQTFEHRLHNSHNHPYCQGRNCTEHSKSRLHKFQNSM